MGNFRLLARDWDRTFNSLKRALPQFEEPLQEAFPDDYEIREQFAEFTEAINKFQRFSIDRLLQVDEATPPADKRPKRPKRHKINGKKRR
tara:strand:+ start:11625 stop:11894 length:270 start_codon:yes stop_codon:yes gene_type:complete